MLITKLRGIEKYPVISTDVTDLVLIKGRKILEYELYIFAFMIHIWLYLQTTEQSAHKMNIHIYTRRQGA